MDEAPMLPAKPIHKAAKVAPDGRVSALCFTTPHAIDLTRASWTLLPADVTCRKCRAAIDLSSRETGDGD